MFTENLPADMQHPAVITGMSQRKKKVQVVV